MFKNIWASVHASRLSRGFQPLVFMRIFDLRTKMPEWKHRKFEKNLQISQKIFYACGRWKSWHIDKV